MNAKEATISILVTLLLSVLVFFIGTQNESTALPVNVYQVYLNGNVIGYLDKKDEFLDLVDKKQDQIKNKYGADKVYPPNGLKIENIATYEDDIKDANEIYNIIENKDPFTIDGYVVKIKYKDPTKKPVSINILNKEDFKTAMLNTIGAFVGTKELAAYQDDKEDVIKDTGEKIESIYWDEDITVKESLISTEKQIFMNADDLSKYLLFGTTKEQATYNVGEGDSVDSIAEKSHISTEEFLIANPKILNANALLSQGQIVNIGVISPIVSIIHEKQVVEDITNNFNTEYQEDNTLSYGIKKTIQEGSNGMSRVTEHIQYRNGQIEQLVITKKEEITPTVNEIIVRGTKTFGGSYTYINTGSEDWYWPTVSPYIITSYFGWRSLGHHSGIDISGCGFGSPIYSSTDGVVVETNNSCSNYGSYGSTCGGSYGNFVKVSILDGKYTIIYAHMKNNVKVSVGETVTRGQNIGYMGDSGSSTGTHLHWQINDSNGTPLNPCKVAFSC